MTCIAKENNTLLQSTQKQKDHNTVLRAKFLKAFLARHGFVNERSPRELGSPREADGMPPALRMQCMYPIHVAAQMADVTILRILLDMGVDPETGAFDGRTALDFAKESDRDGSHRRVVQLLVDKQQVKSIAL